MINKVTYRVLRFFGILMSDTKMAMSQICSKLLGVYTDAASFILPRLEMFTSPVTSQKLIQMALLCLEDGKVHPRTASTHCGMVNWVDI